ncbi:50S ribosomal protein L15 [candidate division KSB1 bacterium]|nr:50S ribosomal protein L15 [candidate division KSB1 bacterium]
MDLSKLTYADKSRKDKKRVGRGGSRGKTSGRGEKGQKSRSGGNIPIWFEGGQMPIQRRLPKRGFKNRNRIEYQVVNVCDLEKLKNVKEINPTVLYEKGLVSRKDKPIKVLGNGELSKTLTIQVHAFSKTAKEKIESAGGRADVL